MALWATKKYRYEYGYRRSRSVTRKKGMVSNKGEELLALLQAGNGMVRNGMERQKSRHRRVCACKWEGAKGEGGQLCLWTGGCD